jgi:hypothetical protein
MMSQLIAIVSGLQERVVFLAIGERVGQELHAIPKGTARGFDASACIFASLHAFHQVLKSGNTGTAHLCRRDPRNRQSGNSFRDDVRSALV